MFKLARSWPELNRIITTILKSFGQVMYLSLLLMLFVFVFALMVSSTLLCAGQLLLAAGTHSTQSNAHKQNALHSLAMNGSGQHGTVND